MQGYETVKVGPLVAKEQSFWEIMDHGIEVLERSKFSAIVGIGPGFAPTNTEKTLLMSYDVSEFSVCLERESGRPGWLTWGPLVTSEKRREEEFARMPVVGKLHWGVRMTSLKPDSIVGQMSAGEGICGESTGGCAAIIDSGTSLIAAPTVYLQALAAYIGGVAEDCSNLHTLPTLLLKLGNETFALPPRAYVMRIS